MTQSNFQLQNSYQCCRQWQECSMILLQLGCVGTSLRKAMENSKNEHESVVNWRKRTRTIQTVDFNLNALLHLQLQKDFLFLFPEIQTMTEFLNWAGATTRNRYTCEPNVATAIALCRLAKTSRWYDAETKFGLSSPRQSEIFWEIIELTEWQTFKLLKLRKFF